MSRLGQILTVLLLSGLAALPVGAEENRYETLMTDLAAAGSQAQADTLAGEIWRIWLTAPDEVAQEVLDSAMTRRQSYDFLGALNHLDRLVKGWPDRFVGVASVDLRDHFVVAWQELVVGNTETQIRAASVAGMMPPELRISRRRPGATPSSSRRR